MQLFGSVWIILFCFWIASGLHTGGVGAFWSILTQRSEAPRRAGVPATLTTGVAAAAL